MSWRSVCAELDSMRMRCIATCGKARRQRNSLEQISMKVIDSAAPKPEPGPLVGGVIVTHGHLGSEFLAAAEMIVGPIAHVTAASIERSEEHTFELQSPVHLVCRLLLEKKNRARALGQVSMTTSKRISLFVHM